MSTNVSAVDAFESEVTTVAFVDLAGFSAITDVYGDASAIAVLGRFGAIFRMSSSSPGLPSRHRDLTALLGCSDIGGV